MKRLGIAVSILALGLAGCGDDNGNPAGPSNLTVFTVQLSPANEVPPITNAENTARGTAVITVNSQANTIDFAIFFFFFFLTPPKPNRRGARVTTRIVHVCRMLRHGDRHAAAGRLRAGADTAAAQCPA